MDRHSQKRPRQSTRCRWVSIGLIGAILLAAWLWPVVPIAQYRKIPSTHVAEGLGTSAEELLPAGIAVRRLSVLQYLFTQSVLADSRRNCELDCPVRVRSPLSLPYAREPRRPSSVWESIKVWFVKEPITYPMKLTLPDSKAIAADLMDAQTTVSTLATVTLSVPGFPPFEVVRNDATPSLATEAKQTWSGKLTDGSGDVVVTVDKNRGLITLVIYRFNDTITVLPSANGGTTYDVDVIPAREQAPNLTQSSPNAGVSSSTAFSDMCESPTSRSADDWISAVLAMKALAEAPIAPKMWCSPQASVAIPGALRWPRLIEHYRTMGTEQCGECIDRLYAFQRTQSAAPVVTVLPVVSSLLLDDDRNNAKIADALDKAQQNINEALKRSLIRGRFKILQPFERIELAKTAPDEWKVLKIDLPQFYKLVRTSGPGLDLADAWAPYAELQRLRRRHNANVVALITLNAAEAADGLTARIPANDNLFFTVVQAGRNFEMSSHSTDAAQDNLAGGHTLAHELGHLVGAMHQVQQPGQRVPPSSHGFEFELDHSGERVPVGTLESQFHRRLLAFSNRCGLCGDHPLGQAWFADSVPTIERQMVEVADLGRDESKRAASRRSVCEAYPRESPVSTPDQQGFEDCAAEPMIFRFDPFKSELADPSRLNACAAQLANRIESRDQKIMDDSTRRGAVRPVAIVAGYADAQGAEADNIGLSWQRADYGARTIRQALMKSEQRAKYDIPLYVCYYGETRPLCDENKAKPAQLDACRYANRRIEVSVIEIPDD